ncbi:CHAT domain-containing protein [Micromonospora sp. AMSO1212t]|uniref:CHAT domain-containing protein n=1 Tax=Micromonospora sp. AMSO1212t TaxID=2650565 RepID=UPI001788BB4C|nr:CHAT domain-containing protein [Micromonospora sp. AMSO1212t]
MRDAKKSVAGTGWHQHVSTNSGSVHATQTGDVNIHETASPDDRIRIRILMLAANPLATARLAIDEEARQITERLRLSRDREVFELITCWAVRPMDLLQYLNQHRPHIVHFSGHGDRSGEILLSADDGIARSVSLASLAELFHATSDNLRVVVVNACHSATAVQAISRYVDYVVGMNAAVPDDDAIAFAASFYSALGFGRTVPQAFKQAAAMLGVNGAADPRIAELVARPGAAPHLMVRSQ